MAVYVTSDAHGHARALDRALELASPGADDEVVVLGDMIDRGPDPLGVIRIVRSIPGVRVLRGNHEEMLLDSIGPGGAMLDFTWMLNGGSTTARDLDALPREELLDIVEWISGLPLHHVAEARGRSWILVHAGIDAELARAVLEDAGVDCSRGAAAATPGQLSYMLGRQRPQDLVWIREEFWTPPTGLVGPDGTGPVVVAGHTPSVVLPRYSDVDADAGRDAEGGGRVVPVGACEATGGVPDRYDVDCSAAMGAPGGRVGVMRLDDGEVWYANVEEGE